MSHFALPCFNCKGCQFERKRIDFGNRDIDIARGNKGDGNYEMCGYSIWLCLFCEQLNRNRILVKFGDEMEAEQRKAASDRLEKAYREYATSNNSMDENPTDGDKFHHQVVTENFVDAAASFCFRGYHQSK